MGAWTTVAAVLSATAVGVLKEAYGAQDQAEKTAAMGDEANNRANARTPDSSAILSAAQQAAKSGVSGTMLTGPTGVTADQLKLGKTSLLGS